MFRRRGGSLLTLGLVGAMVASGCSVALVHGPPSPDDADYDPTGRYEAGVPCTSSRTWPVVDAVVLLACRDAQASAGGPPAASSPW